MLRFLYFQYVLLVKRFVQLFYWINGYLKFKLLGVNCSGFPRINGSINLFVQKNAKIVIGRNFVINSMRMFNPIGREQKSMFKVIGELIIGDHVGMSSIAIVCYKKISIGSNVIFGGNISIYDTDFHSLDFRNRYKKGADIPISKSIIIGNDVFVGAHSTILKGVTIGDKSIIGACSVVTKDIPPNQIWAGNPAKFIRNVDVQ
jgi:acetyltransferase-like isoleucine patch superfamily enzyme